MLKDLFRKRLLSAVVGAATVWLTTVFQDQLGLTADQAMQAVDAIMAIVMTYIGGQSLSDAVAIHKGQKQN